MTEVIYLTGAPGAGKSTLTRNLKALVPELEVFEYGQRLTDFINRHRTEHIAQTELREKSAAIATPDDIKALDVELLTFVDQHRSRVPVIVDSHPVTKEPYGYRITAFKLTEFERLEPTQIWVLYAMPDVVLSRRVSDAGGRPTISEEEARMHMQLQASVAATYGMHVGVPVYLFDSNRPEADLAADLVKRLR
ncbi:MAG: AAA family ATPase [Caulobacteraceae bacterium]